MQTGSGLSGPGLAVLLRACFLGSLRSSFQAGVHRTATTSPARLSFFGQNGRQCYYRLQGKDSIFVWSFVLTHTHTPEKSRRTIVSPLFSCSAKFLFAGSFFSFFFLMPKNIYNWNLKWCSHFLRRGSPGYANRACREHSTTSRGRSTG